MQNIIKYSGLDGLTKDEEKTLKTIVENEYPKIQRQIKNISDLTVHIKTLKKESRKRFIISFRLEAPMIKFNVKTKDTEKGGDWDIAKATHQGLNALNFEIKHRLKTDSGAWKRGGIKKLFDRMGI